MKIIKNIPKKKYIGKNNRIVLIPTMGALHKGHISLIKKAKKTVKNPFIIVSIFINPKQFNNKKDLDNYPSSIKEDIKKLRKEKVDVVFLPKVSHIYPNNFSTYVYENKISKNMEGQFKTNHFQGVCTIVLKLFNILKPDYAVFGKKDFQQLMIIKKMLKDLNLNIKIISIKTAREPDGLAISSRNSKLSKEERQDAKIIFSSLKIAKKEYKKTSNPKKIKLKVKNFINANSTEKKLQIEYIEIFYSKSLVLLSDNQSIDRNKKVRMAIAVKYSNVRLIDNISLN